VGGGGGRCKRKGGRILPTGQQRCTARVINRVCARWRLARECTAGRTCARTCARRPAGAGPAPAGGWGEGPPMPPPRGGNASWAWWRGAIGAAVTLSTARPPRTSSSSPQHPPPPPFPSPSPSSAVGRSRGGSTMRSRSSLPSKFLHSLHLHFTVQYTFPWKHSQYLPRRWEGEEVAFCEKRCRRCYFFRKAILLQTG
jgi:hypothetical protein